MFPKPIQQSPTPNVLRSTNLVESSEKKMNVFTKQPSVVENPPVATSIPVITQSIDLTKLEEDSFKNLVRDKLSKIDEFMILMKDKQDQITQSLSTPATSTSVIQPVIQQTSQSDVKKSGRTKKTYYKINDTMWSDIKSAYVDLADKYKELAYSDGTNYYIEHKNKKVLLDGKGYLKILNDK